jgi:hypothetical protein
VWPLRSLAAFISFKYRPVNLHIAPPLAPSFSPLPTTFIFPAPTFSPLPSTVQEDGSIDAASSDGSEDDQADMTAVVPMRNL